MNYDPQELVEITRKRLDELERRERELFWLEYLGVDNWEWYRGIPDDPDDDDYDWDGQVARDEQAAKMAVNKT